MPSVWRVFVKGNTNPKYQETAVQLLSQINSPLSTKRLAVLAIFGRSEQARRSAGEILLRRDPRDFVEDLVSVLQAPVNYELQRNVTPDVSAEPARGRRTFQPAAVLRSPGGGMAGSATTVRNDRGPAGRTADPIAEDVRAINAHNQTVRAANGPVLAILRDATGQDLGADKESWTAWWTDQQGYSYSPKQPTQKPTLLSYTYVRPLQPPPRTRTETTTAFPPREHRSTPSRPAYGLSRSFPSATGF